MPERAVDRNQPGPPPADAAASAQPKAPDPKYCSNPRCQYFRLSDITRQLHGALSSHELLALILDMAIRATGAERGFLFLLDDKGRAQPQHARSAAGKDLPLNLSTRVSLGVVDQVVRTAKPLCIKSFRDEREWSKRESALHLNLRWAMGAPLSMTKDGKARILGALYLDSRMASAEDVEGYVELVAALCGTAAVSLERSLLLERLQREKDRLASVTRLTAAINSASDLTGLLRVGLDVILKETLSHRGFVMLLEADERRPADRRLRFRVGSDRNGNALAEESFSIHRRHLEDVVRRGESIFQPPSEPPPSASMTDTVMAFRATFPTFIPLKVVEREEEAERAAASVAAVPAVAAAGDKPAPAVTPSAPVRPPGRSIGVICVDSYVDTDESARDNLLLLETLASQLAVAVEKFRLQQLRLEKERIEVELRSAEKVQKFLLPKGFPSFPGLGFGARCLTTHGPGGDYYDFIEIDTDKLAIAMADVSGHGISSSLITCLVRGILRQNCSEETSPAAILERTNRWIKREIPSGMFVSVFLGVLDTDSLALTYCNAGIPHPLLWRPGQAEPALLRVGGMPMGIVRLAKYEEEVVRLAADDALVIYTDGVVEAEGKDGSRFGTTNLVNLLRTGGCHPAQDLVGAIHAGLVSFAGDLHLDDDVTLIAVRVHAGLERETFTFPSSEADLQAALERILATLRRRGFVGEREAQARLVLTEILGNAVEHGNGHDPGRLVSVRLRSDAQRADVTVRDAGGGYDVESVWDTIHSTDTTAQRGRGLFLVAKHVPACRVNRVGNEILIPIPKGLF